MNMDKVICSCMGVTNGMIKDAVYNGASTLEEVQDETGASTACGACLEDVERLVHHFVKEREGKRQLRYVPFMGHTFLYTKFKDKK